MATDANREQVSAIIVGYPKIVANSEPPNRSTPDKCAYRTGEIPAQEPHIIKRAHLFWSRVLSVRSNLSRKEHPVYG
jgi:hypothetical protein